MTDQTAPRAIANALLDAAGFTAEMGGGGCQFDSLYLARGSYVWATCGEGMGLATTTDFCIGVYPAEDVDGLALALHYDSDGLPFAQALKAALDLAYEVDANVDFETTYRVECSKVSAGHNVPTREQVATLVEYREAAPLRLCEVASMGGNVWRWHSYRTVSAEGGRSTALDLIDEGCADSELQGYREAFASLGLDRPASDAL